MVFLFIISPGTGCVRMRMEAVKGETRYQNETENSTKNGPHTDIQNGETGQIPNTHDVP